MRKLASVCVLAFGLGACASHPDLSTRPALNAEAIDHPEKKGLLNGAVEAPLEDANLIRTQIPPVLLDSEEAPYAPPQPASCSHIAEDVAGLDEALGDDFDIHESEDPNTHKGRVAGETMVAIARDAEEDFIPFIGWVRRLSGAQKHANAVRTAVYAGRVRRSYLKGLGQALGCTYPAAPKGSQPLHQTPAAPPKSPQRQASRSRPPLR
jgi:hypothetical protein